MISKGDCQTYVALALVIGSIWGSLATRIDLAALLRGKLRLKRFDS